MGPTQVRLFPNQLHIQLPITLFISFRKEGVFRKNKLTKVRKDQEFPTPIVCVCVCGADVFF